MLLPRRSLGPGLLLLMASALMVAAGCARAPSPEGPGAEVVTLAPPFVDLMQLDGPPPFGGDMADGTAGDWLLRNEHMAVVIGGVGGRDRVRAGRILDAAPSSGDDVLREVRVAAADAPLADPQATYLAVVPDPAGVPRTQRALIARGRVRELPEIAIETRYSLEAGSNVLSIATRFVNGGLDTVAIPAADLILWGEAEPFAPGPGFGFGEAAHTVPFLTGAARGTAYAWWSPGSALDVSGGPTWSHALAKKAVLAPGDSLRVERRLAVRRGSAADAASAVWAAEGIPVGWVTVEADHGDEHVANVRVEIRTPEGRALAWGETSSRGPLVLPVPTGRCMLFVSHPRYGIAPVSALSIEAHGKRKITLRFLDPATVELSALDERGARSPARWRFLGVNGTRDPWFGPRYSASGAAEFLFTPGGADTMAVPPGQYRVRVTRGPGFEAWERDVTLAPGSRTVLRAELASIGLPDSWIALDLGALDRSHPACPVSSSDRALTLACDGIAWSADGRFDDFAAEAHELTLADPGRTDARTYVRADGSNSAAVKEALQEGKTVSTNGPFVEFALDGVEIGGTLRRGPGMARGHVRVIAPAWIDVRRVLIVVNGVVDSAFMVRGRGGSVRFDEDIELYVKNSGLAQVRVEGDEPIPSASARPLAITGPIRVEISGGAR